MEPEMINKIEVYMENTDLADGNKFHLTKTAVEIA
jgi:hypothetical protein